MLRGKKTGGTENRENNVRKAVIGTNKEEYQAHHKK
jgi:hypothetical protein